MLKTMKKTMTSKKWILLLLSVLIVALIAVVSVNNHRNSSGVSLRVFEMESNFWAYEVSVENKPFIIQEHIPGLSGNYKFKSERDARKCGELVLEKMKNSSFPVIRQHELDSLNIEY